MPRANRYFLPEYVWHITHRCHKKEFLLKFARDRRRWMYWLFQAKKPYGVRVLNYTVTSNHIHLLVKGARRREVIPRSMQLSAGRTAQEYNHRKNRKGAYPPRIASPNRSPRCFGVGCGAGSSRF
jgi:putative transposase